MKNNFFLVLIALLTALLLYFVKAIDNPQKIAKDNASTIPQEYMKEAYLIVFSETGDVKEEMTANRWAYVSNAHLSFLRDPHLILYKPDGTIWQIEAKQGILRQPSLGTVEQIELKENVVIERPATPNAVAIKLETHQVNYHPQKQYAESEEVVTMTKPGLKITGTGLRAFLDKGTVELLHNVKTNYLFY